MIMNNFNTEEVDEDIADSIDFMVERVRFGPITHCQYRTVLVQYYTWTM